MKLHDYSYHVCDKCYSLFKEGRLAQYRIRGILVKYVYYCVNHIIDNINSNPSTSYEFSDVGFSSSDE